MATEDGADRVQHPVEPAGESGAGLLDRFDLLLGLTGSCLVVLSLIDMSEPFDDPGALLGVLAVTALLGATMTVALRASGIRRRRRSPWS